MESIQEITFKLCETDARNYETHIILLTNIMKQFKNVYPDIENRCLQLDKVNFFETNTYIINPEIRIDCGQSIILLLMEYYYQMCSHDSLDDIEMKVPVNGSLENNLIFGSLPKKTNIGEVSESNYPIKIEYIKNNVAYKLKNYLSFTNNMGWWVIRMGKFNDISRELIDELWYQDDDDTYDIPESSNEYVYAFFTGKTKQKYNFSFGFFDTLYQKMTNDFEKDLKTHFDFDKDYKGAIEALYNIYKEQLGKESISFFTEIERFIPLIKIPKTDKEKIIIISNCYYNYAMLLTGLT